MDLRSRNDFPETNFTRLSPPRQHCPLGGAPLAGVRDNVAGEAVGAPVPDEGSEKVEELYESHDLDRLSDVSAHMGVWAGRNSTGAAHQSVCKLSFPPPLTNSKICQRWL
eukprot:481806-Alexandrium_andersonii.AAC.1